MSPVSKDTYQDWRNEQLKDPEIVAALRELETGYQIARQELIDDLLAARRAGKAYEEWRRDSSSARPLEEVETELRAKGRLDELHDEQPT